MFHSSVVTKNRENTKPGRGTLVPIVDFTAKNSQSLVIPILLVKITNHHVFLHLIAIYIILKGYR